MAEERKQKEFKADYLKDWKEIDFQPNKVAGINDITINSDISIEN